MRTLMVALFAVVVVGCGPKPTPSNPSPAPEPGGDSGHSHERGKMKLADAGKYHALLTAHLSSKDGHELDLFFETAKNPKPVALPLTSLKAEVQVRSGEGEVKTVEFTPAPPAERPADEAPGTCSHFVAKVPWLNPDVPHRVTIRAVIDGKDEEVRWNDFVPRKYAYHTD